MINVILIISAILLAFVLGTVSGFVVAAESIKVIKISCCACGNNVKDEESVFCEECYEEDDVLRTALKEKEVDIRYKSVSLKQRSVINQPEREELDTLEKDIYNIEKLCENVESISKTLELKVDVEPLKDRTKELKTVVSKWKMLNDKDNKIDTMIWEHEN